MAELFYPWINLEHAAADVANITQSALLITLLSILMLGMIGPQISFWGIHPATVVLIAGYGFGVRLHAHPMWKSRLTRATRPDQPEETPAGESMRRLWIEFAASAVVVVVAGIFLQKRETALNPLDSRS